MAEALARIYGTEEDRVNCPMYTKVGACRNGDQCNRQHCRPTMSQTLLLSHMYPNTPEALAIANEENWDEDMYDRAQAHFEAYYTEVFLELANFGEIEDMVVCDNVGDHMIGNVYVKYYHEESAERALVQLSGRYYSGKLIQAEYSTVTCFRDARCRAFHETRCSRSGYCNFVHLKHVPKAVKRRIVREMYETHTEYLKKAKKSKKDRNAIKDRSRSRDRDRRRDRDKDRGGGGIDMSRQTSEERRAMIAKWNEERDATVS